MPRFERTLKRVLHPVTTPTLRRAIVSARDESFGALARARSFAHGDRMLPSLLIVGAQKAGTTFLHQHLELHPQVRAPLTKELHFFDDRFARGMDWYRGHFPPAADDGTITLESSPGYVFHPHAVRRAAECLPGVRLVVLLRDPTARAFSQFLHERRLGYEPEASFARALDLEPERTDAELARVTADPTHVSFALRHFSYVRRGEYLGQLRRCHEAVGVDRVLVLRSSDLFRDPASVVARTCAFAGLDPWTTPHGVVNDMKAQETERLDEVSKRRLDEHFAPLQRELDDYLGTVDGDA